jgi:hypothetical protein
MSADERATGSGKRKGSKKESYIPKKDRPDFYQPDKPICEYTIRELAAMFEHVEIEIKDLGTKKVLGPFYIRFEALGTHAGRKLNKFTFQGLLTEISKLEWTVSDCETEFRAGAHLIMFRKIGVD